MHSSEFLDDLFGLKGRVAVVVGGTGELCSEMARGLAMTGVQTVLLGRDEDKARMRLASYPASAVPGYSIAADATDRNSLRTAIDSVHSRYGRIDILVNGAGTNSATPFLNIEESEFDRLVSVNLKSVFLACQEFGRHFIDHATKGSIINIGSMAGLSPLSRVFTYSATKAAVHNLSKNLAREWAPHGVRVNTLVPGFFPAEQNRKILTPERTTQILAHTPLGRFGTPTDLVGATLLLASNGAGGFITGCELVVDGGFGSQTI